MAYYTALIAQWATLTGTTAQKLVAVNALTVTGTVPTNFNVTGNQILNCINWAEFNALTPAQQLNLLTLCAVNGNLLGGSANTSFMVDGMILAYFNHTGPTVIALTALAQGTIQNWATASVAAGGGGLGGPVSQADLDATGLS